MGNYNSQYESYYSSLQKRRSYGSYYGRTGKKKAKPKLDSTYFMKRIMLELTGVLILLMIVITCKIVSIPATKGFYAYSKHVVNTNFNINETFNKLKAAKYSDIQAYANRVVLDIKTMLDKISKPSI